MVFVVLGMHKSGTSLVSQILHQSGVDMLENPSRTYDEGNCYERESFRDVNSKILQSDGRFSLDITHGEFSRFMERPEPELSRLVMEEVAHLSECHENWGFKDPRTCYTYPFWKRYLPPHRIVVVYRSPHDLWKRYRKYYRLLKFRGAWKLVKRWTESNLNILDFISQREGQSIVINYDSLMTDDDTFAKLQDFVGVELKDARKPELYRNRAGEGGLVSAFDRLRHMLGYVTAQETLDRLDQLRR